MKKYVCTICGFIYDEAVGIPSAHIAAGTKWEDLPTDWVCPLCGASKADFKEQKAPAASTVPSRPITKEEDSLRELSIGELSAVCSNLARGCEKQYLSTESALFTQLAEYFKGKIPEEDAAALATLSARIDQDLNEGYPDANAAATVRPDRGALRALVWNEKVTRMLRSILTRYETEGDAFLENTNVYVCETCGFVYVGDAPPEICPVCKVPSWKFAKIERR